MTRSGACVESFSSWCWGGAVRGSAEACLRSRRGGTRVRVRGRRRGSAEDASAAACGGARGKRGSPWPRMAPTQGGWQMGIGCGSQACERGQVDEIVDHYPDACRAAAVSSARMSAGAVPFGRHQVAESRRSA